MKFRKFKFGDLHKCTILFRDVFEKEPWNDKWNTEKKAKSYLMDFIKSPNFKGYIVIDEGEIIGASIGQIIKWWQGDEYFIKEFFMNSNKQNMGIGSKFMEYITNDLRENNVKNIVLLTNRGTKAYEFYSKKGFEEIYENAFLYKEL